MSAESARSIAEAPFARQTRPTVVVGIPLQTLAGRYLPCKRALDLLVVGMMAIPALPLIALICLAVRLTSRGPALYSQIRLGRNGQPFRIFKIRSMYHDCERQSGARWSTPGDSRVTPIGRFLRGSHLDELPQLWNVCRGDMSLVGPRPERPEFVPHLEAAIPCYRDRLLVRPGVTGLAQVQLPPDTDLNSVRRKLDCDLAYIEQVCLWLDFRVLLGTFFYVLRLPGVGALRLPCALKQASIETAVSPVAVFNGAQPDNCADLQTQTSA